MLTAQNKGINGLHFRRKNMRFNRIITRRKKKASQDLPFERTFKDGESYQRYHEVLVNNANKTAQLLRGNHGGGFPCPDDICEGSELSENL